MEIQFPSQLILFSSLLSIFIFFKLKTKKTSRNLPPGPWKLPLIGNIINDHRILSDSSDEIEKQEDDLVDVLLRFQADDSLQLPLTTDNIKAVIVDMIGGGSETPATTMDWAMVEMLKNPSVLEKAKDEVRKVFDDKGYVDESSIHQLKYLKSVIKETLPF
ncbi:hypothetical protein DH2020_025495 [Rehmannia glutinosa]|uniref:Uncharacterized protein n=1 Tax=Rehmannia glutinosa TaxID=99300 RepID=A0ABR0W2A0_REHGL